MKKSLFFLASAALVLASCNNDVKLDENTSLVTSNQPKEIAFKALARTPKRAAVVTADFPNGNDMEVAAYLTEPVGQAGDYFTKATFSKNGDYWKGGKYWPLSAAKLNFFAVSGEGLTASHITIASELANATVAYTTANSYSATTQSDIMYAFGRGEVTQSGNALSFPTVAMEFKHALALVDFQVKAATSTEATAITINNITLKGAKYNGTLTLTNTGATAVSGDVTTAVSWVAGDVVATKTVGGISASTVISTTMTRIGEGLMIIPGTGFTSFVINYNLGGKTYDYEYTPLPAVTTTTANYKYTYQITFKLHEIEINPTVSLWQDGGSTFVDVPTQTFAYVASTGITGTFTLPSATAGKYSFAITGLPADDYKAEIGTGTGSFITAVTPDDDTAVAAGAAFNVSFTATADAGNNQTILIKNDEGTTLFTLTVAQP